MIIAAYSIGSVLAVSLMSLVGLSLLGLGQKTLHRLLSVFISFAVGALLGDVFIHILPEMAEGNGFAFGSLLIVLGILLSFVLEKAIHWRHCHDLECETHPRPVGMITLVGDAVHNMVDGMLIAGSYLVSIPTGLATTVAVILHEIPQEVGDFAILLHSGYGRRKALLLNLLTALTAVAGAAFILLARTSVPDLERYLLPLVAGNFLYIAVADLLPELHKHTRVATSVAQLLGVCVGIGLMFALTFLE